MTDQPENYPRSFHVVVKPIGSTCNFDCAYCYYRCKANSSGRISDDLLERFVCEYIAGQEEDTVTFNWHGGEPALLGLDFFRKVIQLERKYANGKCIENDFQTNGVLLDQSWCEFFTGSEKLTLILAQDSPPSSPAPLPPSGRGERGRVFLRDYSSSVRSRARTL